jgi:hypothetical protein
MIGIMVGGKVVDVARDVAATVDVNVGDTDGLKCNVGVLETGGTAQAANNVMIPHNNLKDCFIWDTHSV